MCRGIVYGRVATTSACLNNYFRQNSVTRVCGFIGLGSVCESAGSSAFDSRLIAQTELVEEAGSALAARALGQPLVRLLDHELLVSLAWLGLG